MDTFDWETTCPVNNGQHRYDPDGRCIWCDAENGELYYDFDEVFEDDEPLDIVAEGIIAKHEAINAGIFKLWCWLFGHDWSYTVKVDLNTKELSAFKKCEHCGKVEKHEINVIKENE